MHEIRNAIYNHRGTIDLEYNHPIYGWIPFTAEPDDIEPLGPELHALALAGTVAPFVPPSIEEIRANMPAITPRQLRLTLVRNGRSLASVTDAIAALPEGLAKEEAEIEWEYATTFERTSVTLLTIAGALDMTPEAVDALWEQAVAV